MNSLEALVAQTPVLGAKGPMLHYASVPTFELVSETRHSHAASFPDRPNPFIKLSVPAASFFRRLYFGFWATDTLLDARTPSGDISPSFPVDIAFYFRGQQVNMLQFDLNPKSFSDSDSSQSETESLLSGQRRLFPPTKVYKLQGSAFENEFDIAVESNQNDLSFFSTYNGGTPSYKYRIVVPPMTIVQGCDELRLNLPNLRWNTSSGFGLVGYALGCYSQNLPF